MVKNPPANIGDVKDVVSFPGEEDPLEEDMATHFSILAWRISWTEEPGELQSMGSQGVEHDRATKTFTLSLVWMDESGVIKYPPIIVLLLISPFMTVSICIIH